MANSVSFMKFSVAKPSILWSQRKREEIWKHCRFSCPMVTCTTKRYREKSRSFTPRRIRRVSIWNRSSGPERIRDRSRFSSPVVTVLNTKLQHLEHKDQGDLQAENPAGGRWIYTLSTGTEHPDSGGFRLGMDPGRDGAKVPEKVQPSFPQQVQGRLCAQLNRATNSSRNEVGTQSRSPLVTILCTLELGGAGIVLSRSGEPGPRCPCVCLSVLQNCEGNRTTHTCACAPCRGVEYPWLSTRRP